MDNHYVPNLSIGRWYAPSRTSTRLPIDVHLMVSLWTASFGVRQGGREFISFHPRLRSMWTARSR
jgi:pentose-5-phosphate-3-epimerase